MRALRAILTALAVAIVGVVAAIPPGDAGAQSAIEFLVEKAGPPFQVQDGSNPSDLLVIAGEPLGVLDAGDCAPTGMYPVQAVLINPESAAPGFHTIIAVSQTEPLQDGARLLGLVFLGSCADDTYDRYSAMIE